MCSVWCQPWRRTLTVRIRRSSSSARGRKQRAPRRMAKKPTRKAPRKARSVLGVAGKRSISEYGSPSALISRFDRTDLSAPRCRRRLRCRIRSLRALPILNLKNRLPASPIIRTASQRAARTLLHLFRPERDVRKTQKNGPPFLGRGLLRVHGDRRQRTP